VGKLQLTIGSRADVPRRDRRPSARRFGGLFYSAVDLWCALMKVKNYNEHLRKKWIERGYPGNMGSAAVVPPPPVGFRRLYHLTSAEYAVSDIVFGRLKVARFSKLNDPFELLARSALDGRAPALLADKHKMDQKNGLLCFSEDWIDPVLWTHYGANHKGICLGFDLKEGYAEKITYQNDRLRDEEFVKKTDQEILDLLLYTKFESWRYEREWRVLLELADVTPEGDLHFFAFDDQLRLAEVVLGVDCTLSIEAVRKLLSIHHSSATSVRTRLALGSFAMVPDEETIIAIPET